MADRRVRLVVLLVLGVVLTALGVLFLVVGLDDADKYASVAGAFGTIAGVGVTLTSLIRRRAPGEPAEHSVAGQQVHGSTIGGDSVQVRGVGGNVSIGAGRPPAPAERPRPAGAAPQAPPGAQSVTGSRVGGANIQVDQVSGDVDIERGA